MGKTVERDVDAGARNYHKRRTTSRISQAGQGESGIEGQDQMRQSDAPLPEPSSILPSGDRDRCAGCPLLSGYSGSPCYFGGGTIFYPNRCPTVYRGARDNEATTVDIPSVCSGRGRWDDDRHDDQDLRR